MSRDNYSAELSAAGYFLAEWVCDSENARKLAEILNAGLEQYTRQRADRVNSLGVPCFDDAVPPAKKMPFTPVDPVAKEALSSPGPGTPVAKEVQPPPSDMLGMLSQSFQGAVTGTVLAVQAAVNYGRFFSAQIMDKSLSNRAEVVLKAFNNKIDESNAQTAFLFIGRQPDGWVPAGGVARVSLNTLVLCLVLEHVVKVKASQEKNGGKKEEDPNEKERKAHFALFCTYLKNGLIDPLVMPNQAKQIFIGFESYPDVLSLSQKLIDVDWEDAAPKPPESPKPSA